MENNIQKLLEKNEIEKNYERAVKFYDETIKDKSNFSTIDVSFIASSEIEKNRKDLEKEIYNDIQRKIFACPAAFDSYSTKKRIVQYLKELKATTFTEAINKIESDDRIIMETTAQEEFRQRSIELQEARNKAEKEHQVRQEEFQRIKVEEIKKQREAVQQQNEEMKKTFEDMKKQLEEITSQSNNSTSENYYYSPQTTGLDEYDIERAVERALKNN